MHAALIALALQGAHASPLTPRGPLPSIQSSLTQASEDGGEAEGPKAPGKRRKAPGERKIYFEVNLRGRNMSLPRGVLNIWFTPDDEADARVIEALGEDRARRPDIQGWAYGVELAFKDKRAAGIVWFDWVDSGMGEGYFDDPDNEPLDGDYIVPAPNLGILMFGVDYAYEVPFVKLEKTKGAFGLGLTVGAGIGLGLLVGQHQQWEETENNTPSYELYLAGEDPNSLKELPGVYPIIDFNLGLKFNFADRAHLRLEGGLHTLLYYGAAFGLSF